MPAKSENTKKKEISFEDAVKRLEELAAELENGKTPLGESLKLFEEGIALVSECRKRLDEAEQKVKMLTGNESGDQIK